MKVLVACEFSGVIREAFKAQGHEAWSCDILPSEKEGNHYLGDVRDILRPENHWDLLIAHPPCTYLSYAGNVWLHQPGRLEKRAEAFEFFMMFINANVDKICVENPLGYPARAFRKPDQTIEPYQFGHNVKKRTCLWLKNLPKLVPTTPEVEPPKGKWDGKRYRNWIDVGPHSAKNRSRTFQGIADAMAKQWGAQ